MNNVFLIRSLAGWHERADAISEATIGRIESMLALGAIQSVDEAYRIADAQLAEFSTERVQTDIGITPSNGDVPFVDFGVGDTVMVNGVPHVCLGIAVTEDRDTGRVIYTPTLNANVILDADARIMNALRKALLGFGQGRYIPAQAIIPQYRPQVLAPTAGCEVGAFLETFNTADSPTLGPNLTWVQQNISAPFGANFSGDVEIISNTAEMPDATLVGLSWDRGAGTYCTAVVDTIQQQQSVEATIAGVSSMPAALSGGNYECLSTYRLWAAIDPTGVIPSTGSDGVSGGFLQSFNHNIIGPTDVWVLQAQIVFANTDYAVNLYETGVTNDHALLAPGDVIRFDLTLAAPDLWTGMLYINDVLVHSHSGSGFTAPSTNTAAGFSMQAYGAQSGTVAGQPAWDGAVSIDNFTVTGVCP